MLRWLAAFAVVTRLALAATSAADIARAIRENTFDRDECYRVRDLKLVKEDIRIYFNEGHLIFSKPVAGRRVAAVFTADVEGGDGEILLLPPDRAERRSLAGYINSPNLDEHFRAALLLVTGDDYDALKSQIPSNPANKKTPEAGALMDEEWTPVLRNLGSSYLTRLTLDLLDGPRSRRGLFAALFNGVKIGNFDVAFDPMVSEQILAGQIANRDERTYFDVWTSFAAKSSRQNPATRQPELTMDDYRIEATVNPDLSMNVVTRVKVLPTEDSAAAGFDISPEMEVTGVKVDGRAAEVLQRDSLRQNLTRGGNRLFVVVPPETLRAGRTYEFEFQHTGQVIHDAGDRVFYVSARGSWYPTHQLEFARYDLTFRYPKDLDLVSAGDVVNDHIEGEWRITRRRTGTAIRMAAFNLGRYAHARLERNGFVVDVCANRALETALQPRAEPLVQLPQPVHSRRPTDNLAMTQPPTPDPLARLRVLASEVASAVEFMSAKFGPPALPHLTVSPIPGTFGQGFPGLIYLSTLSYLRDLPGNRTPSSSPQDIFFQDLLQAHETAHQWWGNRVCVGSYRDYWLMEALANYSALLFVEKTKGVRPMEQLLDTYRASLVAKGDNGQIVDSTGPIVLGTRLESSVEPRAWRSITYGKGSWILQMLRRRMGDQRFLAMLAELDKRYDHKEITTDAFREVAAHSLPPKSDDPKLETFFQQWVYGTGIPALKLSWSLKGKAPTLRLVGTLSQSEVDEDFSTLVPVEIQVARGRVVTQWVRSANTPVTFSMALKEAPLKVTLDPHYAVLRR
jgi:hypothetical protein